MVCYNAYSQPAMDNTQNACASNNGFCGGGNSFACTLTDNHLGGVAVPHPDSVQYDL